MTRTSANPSPSSLLSNVPECSEFPLTIGTLVIHGSCSDSEEELASIVQAKLLSCAVRSCHREGRGSNECPSSSRRPHRIACTDGQTNASGASRMRRTRSSWLHRHRQANRRDGDSEPARTIARWRNPRRHRRSFQEQTRLDSRGLLPHRARTQTTGVRRCSSPALYSTSHCREASHEP
jgi:hypothetical protein